jgi:hypothetical protein
MLNIDDSTAEREGFEPSYMDPAPVASRGSTKGEDRLHSYMRPLEGALWFAPGHDGIRAPRPDRYYGLEGQKVRQVWKTPVRPVTHHRLNDSATMVRRVSPNYA